MVIVDDNELTMLGLVGALRAAPEIEVVDAVGHSDALAWPDDQWRTIDAVVVDAADERRDGDQFPGVSVVRRARDATEGARRMLVVVVTGHSLHDGLRYRMAKADADLFFNRSDLGSAAALVDVLLHPDNHRRHLGPTGTSGNERTLGIDGGDVDRLVAYVEEHRLMDALDPAAPVRANPRSRGWLRHRREMAEQAGIEPVNLTTGDRPMEWEAPSIRQLSRIWAWAARVRRDDR